MESEVNVVCKGCNYSKAISEFHPVSHELFISCPRCGYWRQYLEKEHSSVSIKDTNAFIEELDEYYIIGGGGKGAFKLEKDGKLVQVGSLDHNNVDGFDLKVADILEFNKMDKITFTQKQLGVWFEINYVTKEKNVVED